MKVIKRIFKILIILTVTALLVLGGAVIYKVYPLYEEYSLEAARAVEESNRNTF